MTYPMWLPADLGETAFEDIVIKAAVENGWLRHAERPARTKPDRDGTTRHMTAIKGDRGWFDLALSHPHHGIVLAELKTAKGRLGPGQKEWQQSAAAHDVPGSPVLVELWRPADWEAICLCLEHGVDDYRAKYRKPPGYIG